MDIVHRLISEQREAGSKHEYEILTTPDAQDALGTSGESSMVELVGQDDTVGVGGAGAVPSPMDMSSDIENQGLGAMKARRTGANGGVASSFAGGVGGGGGDSGVGAVTGTVNYEKVQTLCLITIAGVLTVAAMQHLRAVMVPLVLAFLVSYPLTAVVDFIYMRGRCPKVRMRVCVCVCVCAPLHSLCTCLPHPHLLFSSFCHMKESCRCR